MTNFTSLRAHFAVSQARDLIDYAFENLPQVIFRDLFIKAPSGEDRPLRINFFDKMRLTTHLPKKLQEH